MQFRPFVFNRENMQIPVVITAMTKQDASVTDKDPVWQTSWTSEYLMDDRFEKYAAKVNGELIALGALRYLKIPWLSISPIWRLIRGRIQRWTEVRLNIPGSAE